MVEGLTVISPELPYELKLIEIPSTEYFQVSQNDIIIESIPVDHGLPCLAYSIKLKRQGKFDVKKAEDLGIPVNYWNRLQKGENISLGDKVITPEMVLGAPRKGIKVCYCTDTRPTEDLVGFIKEADLFICEGMYGEEGDSEKAVDKKHMTFSEAAHLAKQGNVKELYLTHYSPSLIEPDKYIDAAQEIFANTTLGRDLLTTTIQYAD